MTQDNDNLDLNEIDTLPEGFWDEYAEAQTTKTLPPEGNYALRFPDQIGDDAFEVKATKDGQRYLQVTLNPVTIVGGDFDGTTVKYFRVSTRPVQDFVKQSDGSFKPGKTLNASDCGDVLNNFGIDSKPQNKAEWVAAFKQLAGMVTPKPFYLVWGGYDKLATGKGKYLKGKDFPSREDGSKSSVITRTNDAGETRKVYANLQLGRRGAAPRG